MVFHAGKVARFKGAQAEADAAAFAAEMQSRCKRLPDTGEAIEFVITQTTRFGPLLHGAFMPPKFTVDDLGRNGRHDAARGGRALGRIL